MKKKSRQIKYSIIVPIYNSGEMIKETFNSIYDLNFKDFEVIVVNDSNDNTIDYLKYYKNKIKNLRIISRQKSKGLDEAFNYGINLSRGKIIVMCTDDNIFEKNFLNAIDKHYTNNFDCVIVRSKIKNYNNFYSIQQHAYENYKYSNFNNMNWSEGFSAKKKAIIKTGGYPNFGNVRGGNDNILSLNIQKKFKVKRDFHIKMYHRGPTSFKEFVDQQIQRGMAGPQTKIIVKKNFLYVSGFYLIKNFYLIIMLISQLIIIFDIVRYGPYISKKKKINIFKIYITLNIKYLSNIFGEIVALKRL
jgi:glycosyltransferase involved in cell wall biosynthesis